MKNILYLVFLSLLFFACKSDRLITSGSFKDDVTKYRIKTSVDDTSLQEQVEEKIANNDTLPDEQLSFENDINYELEQAAILVAQRNRKVVAETGILGYTIQVYSGTNRKTAEEIRDQLILTYDETTSRTWDRPNYKVKIGEFLSKIEAYPLFLLIKEDFPQAFIVPELIKTDMSKYILEEDK